MAENRTTLRKRVIIGLSAVYWLVALGLAYLMATLEQNHILSAMRPRFLAGDPHTRNMANAAAELADEAQFVTLMCAAALFLTIIVIWRLLLLLGSEKSDRTAARRAARRALFDEPPVQQSAE